MLANNRDDQEGRSVAELIQEERVLRPIRDTISEAEKSFDLQLELLDNSPEVQDISNVIRVHNQTSERIRRELKVKSEALNDNEQLLRGAVAEAKQLHHLIGEAKKKVEEDRVLALAPLYDGLHRAQADLRSQKSAQLHESRQAILPADNGVQDAKYRVSDSFVSPYSFRRGVLSAGSNPTHKIPSTEHVSERLISQRTPTSTTHPLMQRSMAWHDYTQEGIRKEMNVPMDHRNRPRNEGFMNHEDKRSEFAKKVQREYAESVADSGANFSRGPPAPSPSLLGSTTATYFSNGGQGKEKVIKLINFTVSGGFYDHPECMKGVPVAKLSEDDPYWEPSWTKLKDWHPNPSSEASREPSIVFFETCEIHPNQLLGKQYLETGGLCIIRFPIILRRILEVLECAKVVDPLLWLRKRLAELIQRHPKDGVFSLRKTLLDFQKGDPAYQKYYRENRYKSIRHPSFGKKARNHPVVAPVQSHLGDKRGASHASALSTRPSKIPCLEDLGSEVALDVSEDGLATAQSHNRVVRQTASLQALRQPDPTYGTTVEPDKAPELAARERLKAMISGGNFVFEPYFIRCGQTEYGADSPSLKFDAASGTIIPLHPIYGDLSIKLPELVIRTAALERVAFMTGREVGDTVKLGYSPGEGPKMQLGFRTADQAAVFVKVLSLYNKKLELCEEDRKRIAEHDSSGLTGHQT